MEVGRQIKKYRTEMKLSQEALAEQIFVTRQTISNWETEKSYPDIHSLLLLSSFFHISLDQLIKGDVEIMKEEIKETEIKRFRKYGMIYTILLAATMLSAVPLSIWLGFYGLIPWGVIVAFTGYYAIKVEQIKKQHDIQTYKEIVAFSEGKRLDEIKHQEEMIKRPYQKVLLVIGSGAVALAVCILMALLIHFFGG